MDLKRVGEEDDGRVVEEVGAGRVVVTLELYQIFVPLVRFVQLLAVVWLDEVVLFSRGEQRRNEGLLHVRDRVELV